MQLSLFHFSTSFVIFSLFWANGLFDDSLKRMKFEKNLEIAEEEHQKAYWQHFQAVIKMHNKEMRYCERLDRINSGDIKEKEDRNKLERTTAKLHKTRANKEAFSKGQFCSGYAKLADQICICVHALSMIPYFKSENWEFDHDRALETQCVEVSGFSYRTTNSKVFSSNKLPPSIYLLRCPVLHMSKKEWMEQSDYNVYLSPKEIRESLGEKPSSFYPMFVYTKQVNGSFKLVNLCDQPLMHVLGDTYDAAALTCTLM